MQFGKANLRVGTFSADQKDAFIGYLITAGVRGDLEGKWKQYKAALPTIKKKKAPKKSTKE